MALTKITYVDNQTVIGAKNLNDIQDEIIASAPAIHTLTALTAAAMPTYAMASKPTTLIKYGENTYAYAGENGDGVGSWEIRYLCVTNGSSAGTAIYANWLSLQYAPTTYAAAAVSSTSGWVGAIAVTPSGSPTTATSGTLTQGEYAILTNSNTNYIYFNGECYYLADKQHTSGVLTYTHNGYNGGSGVLKYFNITTSTRAWTLTSTTVGGAIDASLSTTSTNAVQNKVITNALNSLNAEVTSLSELIGDYAVFGTIDNQNAISLDGNLVDGTYSVKYCKSDGSSIIVGSFTLGGPSYTNVFVPASATLNARWSNSSAGFTTSGGTGIFASDYIDIGTAQKLYFSGCQWAVNSNIIYYAASKAILAASDASATGYGASPSTQPSVTDGNNSYILLKYKNGVVESAWNNAKYIRVSMKVADSAIATADLSDVVLTLDEEIA